MKKVKAEKIEQVPFIESKEGKETAHVREKSIDKDLDDLAELLKSPAENTGEFDDLGISSGRVADSGNNWEGDLFDDSEPGESEEADEPEKLDYREAAKLNTELIDAITSTGWGLLAGEEPETFMLPSKAKRNIANAMVPILEKYGGAVSPEIRFLVVFVSAQAANYMMFRTIRGKKETYLAENKMEKNLSNIYGAGLANQSQAAGITRTDRKNVVSGNGGNPARKETYKKTGRSVPNYTKPNKVKKQIQTCGYCGESGHNKRKCEFRRKDINRGINRLSMPIDERITNGILQG